jgi:DNA-directed RNA polymerase specialized sigma24 family protein
MGSQTLNEVLLEPPWSKIAGAGLDFAPRKRNTGYQLAKLPIAGPICVGVPMRREPAPASMSSTKITTLDQRLYAWLVQSDTRKFELAFNSYFSVAFPAVVRHLMRISRWEANRLEELAQDALLKFFERVGRDRRVASVAVDQALLHIRPLNCGVFHGRQVTGWSKDVTSFRDASLAFQISESDSSEDSDWKQIVSSLSEQIPVLQRQGCHMVYAVRVDLSWDTCAIDDQSGATISSIRAFAESLATEDTALTERARVADEKHPGVALFVDSASSIIDNLPRLRVPTNGFLFEIALNIYLDECKKRGRQKRGGSDNRASESPAATHESANASQHPMDVINLGVEDTREDETPIDGIARSSQGEAHSNVSAASVDPTIQYEDDDLFEKFYVYLRKPLTDAIEAYQAVQHGKSANVECKKVETLTAKFDRMTAVLALMGEGYTQEETAEQLDLSRNQVKYIMEAVQESYLRFAATSTLISARPTTFREESNAR